MTLPSSPSRAAFIGLLFFLLSLPSVLAQPTNTDCASAISVSELPFNDDGFAALLTPGSLPRACSQAQFVEPAAQLWYNVSLHGDHSDTCISAVSNHYMALHTGGCDDLQCYGQSVPDKLPRTSNDQDVMQWRQSQGDTFQLMVTVDTTPDNTTQTTLYDVSLTAEAACPTNDVCSSPKRISLPYDETDTSSFAVPSVGFPASACGAFDVQDARIVWYDVVGDSSCFCVEMRANWPAIVGIFQNTCDDLSCIDQSDFTSESVAFRAGAGSEYRIAVSSLPGTPPPSGNFNLAVIRSLDSSCPVDPGSSTRWPGSCQEIEATAIPTGSPVQLSTSSPTQVPTMRQTASPILDPVGPSTTPPSESPIGPQSPAPQPAASPTAPIAPPTVPGPAPTSNPTMIPTTLLSMEPSSIPTIEKTSNPTRTTAPTPLPSDMPSDVPSQVPSDMPSSVPTISKAPATITPTSVPATATPSAAPQPTSTSGGTQRFSNMSLSFLFIGLVLEARHVLFA